jgi:hypothetical protein
MDRRNCLITETKGGAKNNDDYDGQPLSNFQLKVAPPRLEKETRTK